MPPSYTWLACGSPRSPGAIAFRHAVAGLPGPFLVRVANNFTCKLFAHDRPGLRAVASSAGTDVAPVTLDVATEGLTGRHDVRSAKRLNLSGRITLSSRQRPPQPMGTITDVAVRRMRIQMDTQALTAAASDAISPVALGLPRSPGAKHVSPRCRPLWY